MRCHAPASRSGERQRMGVNVRQRARLIVLTALALAAAGCSSFGYRGKGGPANRPKVSENGEDFLTSWNANADRIESLVCDSVDVDGRSQGQPYSLNARLAYQRSQQFRLLGKFAGKSEVDLGSNDDEIWFWIARAQPPAVYYVKRRDLERMNLQMPFQPDWIVEAMGVKPLKVKDYHETTGAADQLFFVAEQKAPSGETVTKRVVVNRQTRRVEAFELFNDHQKLLARADILEYHEDPGGLFVPRKIKIDWPDAETKLTLTMSRRAIQFNSISADWAQKLFQRGEYTNTEVIDLARASSRRPGPTVDGPPSRANEQASRGPDPDARPPRSRGARLDEGVRPAQLTGRVEPIEPRRAGGLPSFGPER